MSIEAYTAYRRASRRRSSRTPFNPLRSIENEVELTGDINATDNSDLEDVGVKIRTEIFTDLYTVEAELGRGKFATVKKCRCNATGEVFAAKIQRKRRKGVDARQELIHEIRMLALCKIHPRIIGLKEVFENRHEIIIITSFASGGELYRHMECREEGFSEVQVRHVLRHTLEGLAFLHQRNIVHMDIKPQNLLLSDSHLTSDVLLCDLGFSRTVSNDKDVREIVGTPDFVAPEVLNYEPISTAVDMWSVGVLTYMLLSGCSPFAGADKMETFSNITQAKVDFPDDMFQHTSETAKDFVRKLLKRNPSGRLTATECLDHPWMEEEGAESSGEGHSACSTSYDSDAEDRLTEKQDSEKVCSDPVLQGDVGSDHTLDSECTGCEDHTQCHTEECHTEECKECMVKSHQSTQCEDNKQQCTESKDSTCTDCEDNTYRCEDTSQQCEVKDQQFTMHEDSNTAEDSVTEDTLRELVEVKSIERGRCEGRGYLHSVSECEVLPPLIEECEELPPLSKAQKDICNARRVQQSPLSSPVGCRRTLAPSPETVLETEPSKKHTCRRGSAEVTQMLKVQHTGVLDLEVDTDTNAVVCKRGNVRKTPITSLPHTKSLVTFYENLLHHS